LEKPGGGHDEDGLEPTTELHEGSNDAPVVAESTSANAVFNGSVSTAGGQLPSNIFHPMKSSVVVVVVVVEVGFRKRAAEEVVEKSNWFGQMLGCDGALLGQAGK
jgi:hypothetical protein